MQNLVSSRTASIVIENRQNFHFFYWKQLRNVLKSPIYLHGLYFCHLCNQDRKICWQSPLLSFSLSAVFFALMKAKELCTQGSCSEIVLWGQTWPKRGALPLEIHRFRDLTRCFTFRFCDWVHARHNSYLCANAPHSSLNNPWTFTGLLWYSQKDWENLSCWLLGTLSLSPDFPFFLAVCLNLIYCTQIHLSVTFYFLILSNLFERIWEVERKYPYI